MTGRTANGRRLEAAVEQVQSHAAGLQARLPRSSNLRVADHHRLTDKMAVAADRLEGALRTEAAMLADCCAAAGEHQLAEDTAKLCADAAGGVREAKNLLSAAARHLHADARLVRDQPGQGHSGTTPARSSANDLASALYKVEIFRIGDVNIGSHARVILLYRQTVISFAAACNTESLAADEALRKLGRMFDGPPFPEAHHIEQAAAWMSTADRDLKDLQRLL